MVGNLIYHGLKPVATNITPLTGLKHLSRGLSPQERGRYVTVGVFLRVYLKVIRRNAVTNCA